MINSELLAMIGSMILDDISSQEISNRLDLDIITIQNIYELYVNKPKDSRVIIRFETLIEVILALEDKKSNREIANMLHVSEAVVSKWITKYNLDGKSRRYKLMNDDNYLKEYLQDLFDDGNTYQEISEKTGITIDKIFAMNEKFHFREIKRRTGDVRDNQIKEAKALKELGYSKIEIGRRLNIHRTTVTKLLNQECHI